MTTETSKARKALKTLVAEANEIETVVAEKPVTKRVSKPAAPMARKAPKAEPVEVDETDEADVIDVEPVVEDKPAKTLSPKVAAAKAKAEKAKLAHAEAVKALAAAKERRKATLAALMLANEEWAEATRSARMDKAAKLTGKAATDLLPE